MARLSQKGQTATNSLGHQPEPNSIVSFSSSFCFKVNFFLKWSKNCDTMGTATRRWRHTNTARGAQVTDLRVWAEMGRKDYTQTIQTQGTEPPCMKINAWKRLPWEGWGWWKGKQNMALRTAPTFVPFKGRRRPCLSHPEATWRLS